MLEELGLDYEHEPIDFRDHGTEKPEYLRINPNGRIPTLRDGELTLYESMAINLYLASRYGREAGLWPSTAEGEGLAYQWSFWVMTEVEHPLLMVLMHKRVLPEDKRDPERAKRNAGLLARPFEILEQALAGKEYLLEERFTVADLNVAAVLSWARPARYPLHDFPHLKVWSERCLARPASKAARRK
jgi:glutathione S-transferase